MAITASTGESTHNGPRPINMAKDVAQVLALLELVFGDNMDAVNRRMLQDSLGQSQAPGFLWRLNPMVAKLAQGFVWEDNGRIVGNATLLNTKQPGRYIVVNVAVHPHYRRRGIARGLMEMLEARVRQQNGREILLQVVKDNLPAVYLYQMLGYKSLGSMATWQSSVSQVRELLVDETTVLPSPIRELYPNEWQAAFQLDVTAVPQRLNWPEPLPEDVYKSGLWQRFNHFMNGRSQETWVIANGQGQLVGLASIWSEWGRMHQANVRVHPVWQGVLERPLLAKITRRLKYFPRRNIQIIHPDDDIVTTQLLERANFYPRRVLTHMRKQL
ncbi:MAG: hypothetical protein Kow0080_18580 [Candidatus Promineifilaceae bacterium]